MYILLVLTVYGFRALMQYQSHQSPDMLQTSLYRSGIVFFYSLSSLFTTSIRVAVTFLNPHFSMSFTLLSTPERGLLKPSGSFLSTLMYPRLDNENVSIARFLVIPPPTPSLFPDILVVNAYIFPPGFTTRIHSLTAFFGLRSVHKTQRLTTALKLSSSKSNDSASPILRYVSSPLSRAFFFASDSIPSLISTPAMSCPNSASISERKPVPVPTSSILSFSSQNSLEKKELFQTSISITASNPCALL